MRNRPRAHAFDPELRAALRASRLIEPSTGRVIGAEIPRGGLVAGLALAERALRRAAVRASDDDFAHAEASPATSPLRAVPLASGPAGSLSVA
jgi:hypothetical protein